MLFSKRTPVDISLNPIAKAIEQDKRRTLLDLTESNPTHCGFDYPSQLLSKFGSPEALTYEPFPFGLPQARKAVADYLNAKGQKVRPENVILTASTSEAYSFLFKLLGDSGSSFLTPTPGYPLLDHLLRLEGMELIPYSFKTAVDWPLDLDGTKKAVNSACRGLLWLILITPPAPF